MSPKQLAGLASTSRMQPIPALIHSTGRLICRYIHLGTLLSTTHVFCSFNRTIIRCRPCAKRPIVDYTHLSPSIYRQFQSCSSRAKSASKGSSVLSSAGRVMPVPTFCSVEFSQCKLSNTVSLPSKLLIPISCGQGCC